MEGVHWLAGRIERVLDLVPDTAAAGDQARKSRQVFLGEITLLVDEVAKRSGVTASFASYEGFVVASSGVDSDLADALAAMAQSSMEPARHTAGALSLGNLRQLVIVGDKNKLALIRVGPVALGVLSPAGVNLGESTAA